MNTVAPAMSNGLPTVIVTQCDFRFGFNVARSLASAGYPVVAMAQAFPSMSDSLPGIVGKMTYPNPFADPEGYITSISSAATQWRASVFLPVHEDVFVASRHRERLPGSVRVLAPSYPTLLSLHDKYNLAGISASDGLNCPMTILVEDPADIGREVAGLGGKAVLKPRFGEGGTGRMIVSSSSIARDRQRIAKALKLQCYVLQRYVPGEGVCIGLLARDGVLLAISGHRRIRELPRNGGTSTARRVFHDEALFSRIARFVERIGYSGILMLEFRYDASTGNAWLIDANPRYWGGLSLHLAAGVDYPVLHLASALDTWRDQAQVSTAEANQQLESRWLLGEIMRALVCTMSLDFTGALAPLRRESDLRVLYEDSGALGARGIAAQVYAYLRTGRRKSTAAILRNRQEFFHAPH